VGVVGTRRDETEIGSRRSAERRLASAAIGIAGLIHLVLAPSYYEKAPYLGVLFIVAAVGAAYVAVRLWRENDHRVWLLGGILAGSMALGFVLSRTTGLPGFHNRNWEFWGVISALLEIGFVAAWVNRGREPARGVRGVIRTQAMKY
jgi:hypothetical protein